MKKTVILFLISSFFYFPVTGQDANVVKESFLFSDRDGRQLYLDRYEIPTPLNVTRPCVIFMFGGGFGAGARDMDRYAAYYNFLAENGYVVAAIDYRLGLKDISPDNDLSKHRLMALFVNAINIAVEDLYDATNYILENAEAWNVDTERIITCGSSAGGIAVLQGEHGICNGHVAASVLPEGFNYRAVVSFAGAILEAGELQWQNKPCPIMMFHGDADSNVPYGALTGFGFGFYGSAYVAETLSGINSPYWFYSVTDADHSIAISPMNDKQNEILSFFDLYICENKPLIRNTFEKEVGTPVAYKKFTIMDYINSNLPN